MTLYMLSNIFVCVCAFLGFLFGVIRFFKPHKAIYAQMITLAIACIAFGRLYQTIRLLTGGRITGEFQLGFVGVIGSLLFFFTANFGTMDSLVDDGSKRFLKFRLISLTAPVAVLALYLLFVLFADYPILVKVLGGVLAVFAMEASYFNLKHLILPDVDFGIVNCLKAYNLIALIYTFLSIGEFIALCKENSIASSVIGILIGATVLCIVPAVSRGIKKWTT